MQQVHWLVVALCIGAMGGCQKRSGQQLQGQPSAAGALAEPEKALAEQEKQVEADAVRPHAEAQLGERVARARAAVGRLKRALKGALQRALPAGFDAAVAACQLRAPEVASALSTRDVVVGRATDRPRNPNNGLQAWMKPLMARFAQGKAQGGAFETLSLPDGRWAYAEPIRVLPLCVVCHGKSLASPVREALAKRYPDDKATGYAVGDLRGIFWATIDGI